MNAFIYSYCRNDYPQRSMNWKLNNFNMSILFPVITVNKQNLTIYFKKEFSLVPSTPRANFFPTLLCGVLVFFAAPPRSSSALLPPSSFLLSNYNLSHTTSTRRQHPTHNVLHTTSLTQHLSQRHLTHNTQHHSRNIGCHRGRMTKHHSENIPHTTSHTPQHTHNISHNNISHTTAHTQHHSQAQHISWQAQHFAACQGVGCTPWRRLGTGAGCADFSRRSTL